MNILSSILVFVCVVTNVLAVTVMVEDTISESHTSIFTSGIIVYHFFHLNKYSITIIFTTYIHTTFKKGTDSDIPCASEHVYRDADGSTRMTAVK